MALCSDTVMMLFYGITGNTRDHDDWHSYEHFYERLSVPGFIRATRWVATSDEPRRYMVMYEVCDPAIATSSAYLDRLNKPTAWTTQMMGRFSGMIRGFCTIAASEGFGLGNLGIAMRFMPQKGMEQKLSRQLAEEVFPAMAAQRGIVGCHLMEPAPSPPMTHEQSLRGPDKPMPWLVFVTAYNAEVLERARVEHLDVAQVRKLITGDETVIGNYTLDHSATQLEVARTRQPVVLSPEVRS